MDFKNDRAPNLFFNKESNSNQATLLRIRQFLSKTSILKNLLRIDPQYYDYNILHT